ncbi:MAG TPA: riboflavin synthase [Gemmatales bacterium]|nr:riboflavin synthase [Gemmatales bacterium]
MFTGLVDTMGTVQSLQAEGAGQRLIIDTPPFYSIFILGESIAINGVCLTVIETKPGMIAFQLAPETLRKSNLGNLIPGSRVNLEQALQMGDRLGGHWVQGHVDGVGTLLRRELDGDWEKFIFQMPSSLARYLVAKGSITINGVSLTVVDAHNESFSVSLIPHTLAITNLGLLKAGDVVNLEVDILAKYVEKMVTK